jgi:hypothetical protein
MPRRRSWPSTIRRLLVDVGTLAGFAVRSRSQLHSEYDGAYTKARLIAAPRQVGETHPFIVGTDGVQRYFTVMSECATASKQRAGAK